MDQYTRRIIGFAVHAGDVDGQGDAGIQMLLHAGVFLEDLAHEFAQGFRLDLQRFCPAEGGAEGGEFGSQIEIVEFNPDMIWDGNDVIIRASEINRLHGGDQTIELDVTQVFKVKNGWIKEFQEYVDTDKMASLFK